MLTDTHCHLFYEQLKNDLVVSKLDDHPNAKGHKAIADFLRKEIT